MGEPLAQKHSLTLMRSVAGMKPAAVLVSGGMDSAVVLAIVCEQGYAAHALSLRYG